jgi:hypothetical protein
MSILDRITDEGTEIAEIIIESTKYSNSSNSINNQSITVQPTTAKMPNQIKTMSYMICSHLMTNYLHRVKRIKVGI